MRRFLGLFTVTNLQGLAYNPTTNPLYGSFQSAGLGTINPATGAVTTIGGSVFGGLAFDSSNNLYGLDSAGYHSVNTATRAGTLIGSTSSHMGLACDASPGKFDNSYFNGGLLTFGQINSARSR